MSYTDTKLQKMTAKELAELERKVALAKQAAQDRARADLRQKVIDMVTDAGLKIGDILGGKSIKGRKVAAKYVNPTNPSETWTGRGRMPRWLATATGGVKSKVEEYRIK